MGDDQELSGVDLDTLVPDPNAIDDTIINDPIAAWPGATSSIIVRVFSDDGLVIIQQGNNNGDPDIVWQREKPLEGGDWSDWKQLEQL